MIAGERDGWVEMGGVESMKRNLIHNNINEKFYQKS